MSEDFPMLMDLQKKVEDMQAKVEELSGELNRKAAELEQKEAEVKKKSDLCIMYKHILDEKTKQFDDMTDSYEADEARIADMRATIDTLASRIAELKKC